MNAPKIFVFTLLLCVGGSVSSADENPETLKIITHNVWYGFTKKPEPRHSDWRQWMAAQSPDVVALQELNGYTPEKLAEDAKSWGHEHTVLLKEDGFPTGITSRYPISDVRRIRDGMHHGLLRCRIQGLWFYVIHFHPSNFAHRIEEAAHLKADVASLPDPNPRIVLAGDFNGFSPADRAHYESDPELVPFFEMLDRRDAGARNLNQGRLDYGGMNAILTQGFIDVVDHFRSDDEEFVGTFPSPLVSDENHGTDRRLDYIFVSPNLISQVVSAEILRDEQTERFSDHFPVAAVIRLEGNGDSSDDSSASLSGKRDTSGLGQSNWPQFRGPNANGVADNEGLPAHWSATENVAWKRDIPGRGWSSPIVWGERVFLTTVINPDPTELPKKGLYFGGEQPEPPASVRQWKVFCLDLRTGDVLWERLAHEGRPETTIHLKSSYASETPVTDGQRLYCYFGNVGVFCYDLNGQELWKHPIESRATRNGWGTAASPVLYQDRLYLVNDNDEDSYLMALDAATGETVWRVPRDEKSNWATPFIWRNDQRTEIVTPGSDKVRSYDLDGNLLWSLTGMSSITIATPQEHGGLLYLSSGYVGDSLRPIYAIRPGAEGDISLQGEETANEFIAWSDPKAAPYNPTPLIYRDRIYVLYDRGLLSAFDASDGQRIFGPERLPDGRAFTASPWAYDGKVFCLNEDGVTFVLQAGDQFELLHTNALADDDMCMATPAIAGDRLLIRTAARVYCIEENGG